MTDLYWDPMTPELREDPYPLWKRLRDEAPVYRNDELDFYALSRFHDIEAANRDAATFSSNHGTVLETMTPEPMDTPMIIFLDPPKHTMLRTLVSRAFTTRRVSMLEDRIREICARLLDAQVGAGRFDYVQDFSTVLPPLVISSLLGVPEGEQHELRRLVDGIFHMEEGVGMANAVSQAALVDLALGAQRALHGPADQPARRRVHGSRPGRGHRRARRGSPAHRHGAGRVRRLALQCGERDRDPSPRLGRQRARRVRGAAGRAGGGSLVDPERGGGDPAVRAALAGERTVDDPRRDRGRHDDPRRFARSSSSPVRPVVTSGSTRTPMSSTCTARSTCT